jgi:hypothetical protein
MSDYDPEAVLADPFAPAIHKMYAEINIGVRDRGERWAKCSNCGEPYQITPEWPNETFDSSRCEEEYRHYLADPGWS